MLLATWSGSSFQTVTTRYNDMAAKANESAAYVPVKDAPDSVEYSADDTAQRVSGQTAGEGPSDDGSAANQATDS